jgi:hypothetical protein
LSKVNDFVLPPQSLADLRKIFKDDKYEIIKHIGSGLSSNVYIGSQRDNPQQKVAIKLINSEYMDADGN